ncbi:30S ribosome-binding factor RbfA [Natronogracilivirga saccharolytica]|uniref:Ribosome-binding factor A n=1 Tax=Natronogracilivirga saccharolytica TaxID=2812953 RepID=A0A8J7S9Y9_9BACT|nr:30S ribosome-binding factor RbfA [Natronogracilivirga saccharolytica]MBP3193163.1 30S ribosome-binding factor RbfA [Natronogracilivirga saccharolytica]
MSIRTERVAALLKSDIGGILQMEYQHDAMLTVTTVRVSPDLMQAHVYLSIFSNQDNNTEIFEFIREKTPEIRKKLASRIRHQVRRIPEIHFHLDDTAEYVEKIDALFRKIHDENKDAGDRDQGSEDSGSEDKGSS